MTGMEKLLWAVGIVFMLHSGGCAGGGLPPGDPVRGKALFADTALGTNGKSCNTCHTGMGRGDKNLVGEKPFEHTIRDCIQASLQGDPGQDQAVADLKAYIESLK